MQLKHARTLPAHADRVWHLAAHPSLPLLAAATSDNSAQVFSLTNFLPLASLDGNHKRSVRALAWKPTTEYSKEVVLATASFDGTVGVWVRGEGMDIQDGDSDDEGGLEEWEFVASLEGHENEVKSVAWSGDGQFLASCSRDKTVWIWEADDDNEEFECVAVLQEHAQDVKHVVWHPLENLLASASYDDAIRLWREDDDDWVCAAEIVGHTSTVWCIDFDKRVPENGARIVSCSADESVRVWTRVSVSGLRGPRDIPSTFRSDPVSENWVQEAVLPAAHMGPIYSVAWSGISGRIASVGGDGLLVVYEETEKGTWTIVTQQHDAHSVFEVNSVLWTRQYRQQSDSLTEPVELLLTAGDDGNINVWEASLK
ncbi:WD40-repeat-containing domain protein [Limtongia smithiae]|uniref:WD40-repeat-containing domain protein n=1 Tax=Limtongia smithiae TaxID=1125753 RepID=UPI0034CFBF3F